MSEQVETPRNPENGQFTPAEPLVGREAENAAHGFKTRKDPPAAPDGTTYGDTLDELKEAASDLAARRIEGPIEIDVDVVREHLGKPDLTEALTPAQAAKDLSAARGEVGKYVEGFNLTEFQSQVDKARAEEMKKNPRAIDELGLSKEDVDNAKKAGDEESVDEPKRPDTAARPDQPGDDAVEGLDPELARTIREHPQVRQFLEEQHSRAAQAEQSYGLGLEAARHAAIASISDHFPELLQIPTENWQAALQIFQQQAPDRYERAMGVLQRGAQIEQAQAQWQQQQAAMQRQQFEQTRQAYSRAADAALGPMTVAEKIEMTEELVAYVEQHGISREQLAREAQTNLALHHPAFQKMAADALKWNRQQSMPRPRATLPPVQRPGLSTGRSANSDSKGKVAALQAQLEGARGDKAARIAAQIRSIKRNS
jgi:hypothetical protein